MEGSTSPAKATLAKSAVSDDLPVFSDHSGSPTSPSTDQLTLSPLSSNSLFNGSSIHSNDEFEEPFGSRYSPPIYSCIREQAEAFVEQVMCESLKQVAHKWEQPTDESSAEEPSTAAFDSLSDDSPCPVPCPAAGSNPDVALHAFSNPSHSDLECHSTGSNDSDSSVSSNQSASKATANSNNKRKKKNQRKKSNSSTASANTTSSPIVTTNGTNNDLASPKPGSLSAPPKETEEKKVLTPLPSPKTSPLPSPKASPLPSPKASPLPSPKASPLPSPKASPLPSPKASPLPSPKASPLPSPPASPLRKKSASPSSGRKTSSDSKPKCQTVPVEAPKEDVVVQSGIVSSEEKSQSGNVTEVVQCGAIEEVTANQTNSSATPSSGISSTEKPSSESLLAEDSSVEQNPSKATDSLSIASDASIDQSMDDAEWKGKPNGKPFAQHNGAPGGESMCKICDKHVYHMEQIKAEKGVFHKACFRCQECNKQLKVDSYSSHEGVIYCKPHFKQLFQPKAVFEADFKQTSAKPDEVLGNINLDLSNIRNRFENASDKSNDSTDSKKSPENKPITRSESIHKIMQKYQSRVAGDKDITTSSDEEDTPTESGKAEETDKPQKINFTGMSALKSQWESGSIKANAKSEKDRVGEELAELRSKVKTAEPLKNAYERAVQEAKSVENLASKNDGIVVDSSVKAVSIKEKFEKGKVELETEEDRIERLRKEREEEISRISQSETCTKEARNMFKQYENNLGKEQTANGGAAAPNSQIEDSISSNELQQRFNFFEKKEFNQSANAKEGSGDETDAKGDEIPKADTTKKMLDKFKALEAGQQSNGQVNGGGAPKSPIRITPPRETAKVFESEPAAERDPNIVRSSYKSDEPGDINVEPEKAKNLRAKFENWQTEIEREGRKSENEDEFVPHIDTTKNLRAMFESIKEEYKPIEKPRPRINRFVQDSKAPPGEVCYVCSSRLYPMEKMEFSGIKIHKNCFRCNKCHAPLRLDNFTVTAEKLFCIPHFKQLFMEKGNYDEGFGLEQHKDKWSNKAPTNGKTNGVEKLNGDANGLKPVTNGNGIHHEDDVEVEVEENQPESLDHQSTEGEDEPPFSSHETVEEPDEDLAVLQHQVGHLELDEVLDSQIAVDNQA